MRCLFLLLLSIAPLSALFYLAALGTTIYTASLGSIIVAVLGIP
jgi:hypothetical protein